ncbi:hypothetical protein BN179_2590003 [Clostridioides difficile T6]|nr:hypothetical protein BN179_2590003 [Clostridioides difficile T6]
MKNIVLSPNTNVKNRIMILNAILIGNNMILKKTLNIIIFSSILITYVFFSFLLI